MEILNDIDVNEINNVKLNSSKRKTNLTEIDKLKINGNVTIGHINGYPLQTFLDSLVYTDEKTYIPGDVVVNGVKLNFFLPRTSTI